MRFIGWSGAAAPARRDCAVTLASAQTVAALFGPATIAVKVTTAGRGHGPLRAAVLELRSAPARRSA